MTEALACKTIISDIRNFVNVNFMLDPLLDIFSDDDSLVAKGIVDSYGIIEIVSFMEERWEIKIQDSEVTRQNFGSLNKMADFVLMKKGCV